MVEAIVGACAIRLDEAASSIEPIVEYLKNPIAVGVHNLVAVLDFVGVSSYAEGLVTQYEKSLEPGGVKGPSPFGSERLPRLKAELDELRGADSFDEDYFAILPRVLAEVAIHCECPPEMKQLFLQEERVTIRGKERVHYRRRRPTVLSSETLSKSRDVVHISRQHMDEERWLFDVTSIKEDGISKFKTVAAAIPPIREHMSVLREGKRHSSRVSFRPYPLSVRLWLHDESSASIPSDLKSYLEGAVDYIDQEESRTSIILSAIAVESELADMYEESHRSPAPDVPLGDLFQKVKVKVDFPEDVVQAIETTNRARIAAVHRSRLPVSQREATTALYGAVNFTCWHLFEHL